MNVFYVLSLSVKISIITGLTARQNRQDTCGLHMAQRTKLLAETNSDSVS